MGKKKMLMRKFGVSIVNNTFIGGVASVINTPTLLAAKLQYYPSGAALSENDIQNFTIVGDDIECYIGVDYQIKKDAFQNTDYTTSSPTYYKDEGSKCKRLQVNSFDVSLNTSYFYFPAVVSVLNACFYHANYTDLQPRIIYLPICTSVSGDPTVLDIEQFGFGNITQKLYIDIFNKTSNNGGINATIAHSIANDNLTVSWVENLMKPQEITDLSVNVVYATAIKLDWSTPTSTNAIDYYEVYIDGVFYENVSTNEITILGLTNLQTYNFSVIAVDIFYNKSEFSNIVTQQINGVANFVENIISYYKFENDVLDSVGTNDGTATDITSASGKVGNAWVFNGSTSNILIPYNGNLSFTNGTIDLPFSVSFFVKHTVNGNIIYIAKTQGTFRMWEIIREANTLVFRLSSNGNVANRIEKYLSWTPVIGQWYHITATYNGNKSVSGMNLYIDKVSIGLTRTIGSTYSGLLNNTDSVMIGKYPTLTSYTLNGSLDETAIFNKELSQTEVIEIYDLHNSGLHLI